MKNFLFWLSGMLLGMGIGFDGLKVKLPLLVLGGAALYAYKMLKPEA